MKLPTDKYFEKYLLFHFGLLILAIILLTIVCFFLYKQINLQSSVDDSLQSQITNLQNQSLKKSDSQIIVANNSTSNETTEWKTFRNDKYGFELKYPVQLNFKDRTEKNVNVYVKETPGSSLGPQLSFYFSVVGVDLSFAMEKKPTNYKNLQTYIAEKVSEGESNHGAASSYYKTEKMTIGGREGLAIIINMAVVTGYEAVSVYFDSPEGIFRVSYSFLSALVSGPEKVDDEALSYQTIQDILSTFKFTK